MKTRQIERDYLDRCQSLAVLGGTFDPIHMGHLAIAKAVSSQLKPQRVLFLPCGQPAHKHDRQITHPMHRYQMTALATCCEPSFDISRLELERPGTSYTIDTIKALTAICPKGAEISFIIGADSVKEMKLWRSIKELLGICRFIVVPRPGQEDVGSHIDFMTKNYGGRFNLLDGPLIDASSSDIRERLANGRSVQELVPGIVENYIHAHGLYNAIKRDSPLENQNKLSNINIQQPPNFDKAQEELRIRLSPKRFTHTLGVVKEVEKLAHHYSQDIQKARWAALLHDCTKEYSADKKRTLCKLWNVQLDEVFEANIDITHSLLSAESAKRDFHIKDQEILQAIRYHTTGHKGMNMLDKIVMLADYTEPYREDWGSLKEMRHLAYTNIDKALILGTKHTVKEETEAGNPIHPWSIDALKELKEEHSGK